MSNSSEGLSPTEKRKLLSQLLAKTTGKPALYPLSYAQELMWFRWGMDRGSAAYNIGGRMRMEGELDKEALERAVNEIKRRHEVLRTVFVMEGEEAAQRVQKHEREVVEEVDLEGLGEE